MQGRSPVASVVSLLRPGRVRVCAGTLLLVLFLLGQSSETLAQVAEPVPVVKPTRTTSPTLQSPAATEAVARKLGLVRPLDRNREHVLTLRPPLPVYSSPSEPRIVAPPLLWDQFLDDYGKSSGELALEDGSSSFLMGPPAPTGEWRTPGDGGVLSRVTELAGFRARLT